MAPHRTFLVIGAGQAAGRAVEAMRNEGFEGRIVLVGAEEHPPYERPPLSKQLLTGDYEPARTYLHDQAFYDERHIELRLATSALAIDRAARTVRLSDGDTLDYDKLLLTTGARVRRLSSPGADLPGIHYLRDITDCLAIRGHFSDGARLVIVGGGYIGLEAAAAATSQGWSCDRIGNGATGHEPRGGAANQPVLRGRPPGPWRRHPHRRGGRGIRRR